MIKDGNPKQVGVVVSRIQSEEGNFMNQSSLLGSPFDQILLILGGIGGAATLVSWIAKGVHSWNQEHPKIRLILNSWGAGNTGKQQIGITAHYIAGKKPITLHQPVYVYETHGIVTFFFPLSGLKPLSLENPTATYELGLNPYPMERVISASMKDLSGKTYYAHDFPSEYKATLIKKLKWKFTNLVTKKRS